MQECDKLSPKCFPSFCYFLFTQALKHKNPPTACDKEMEKLYAAGNSHILGQHHRTPAPGMTRVNYLKMQNNNRALFCLPQDKHTFNVFVTHYPTKPDGLYITKISLIFQIRKNPPKRANEWLPLYLLPRATL